MKSIVSHEHPVYKEMRKALGDQGRYNGAYYYSMEICERMIPKIRTDRPWITVNVKLPDLAQDGAIVLGHANAPATDAILERYLQAATEQGYRLVTVSELFAARCPKPPCGTPIGGVRADGTLYVGNQG